MLTRFKHFSFELTPNSTVKRLNLKMKNSPENQSGEGPNIVANESKWCVFDTVKTVDVFLSTLGNHSPFAVIKLRRTLKFDYFKILYILKKPK